MFGYIHIYRPDLNEVDYQRYRSVYCGLCKAIGRQLNQVSRMALTFDVTFICLLLFALIDDEPSSKMETCVAHPLKKHLTDQDHLIYRQAALLTSALVYLKADDNIRDQEQVFLSKVVLKAMKKGFSRFFQEDHLSQKEMLEAQKALFEVERLSENISPFLLASKNGSLMVSLWKRFLLNLKAEGLCWAKIYQGFEVELEERLTVLFEILMQWIYFLDACDDWEKDKKRGKPNPFVFCQNKNELWQAALPIFYDLEHRLDCSAEQLYFVRDGAVIGNILRAGLPLRREAVQQKMLQSL